MAQIHPTELVQQLLNEAKSETDSNKRARLKEAADAINYLMILLELCADYIHDNNEYGLDPRFLRAIQDMFPDKKL